MVNMDATKVTTGVIHHVGVKGVDSTAADTNNYHRNTKGWAGIGYHFQIMFNGEIQAGRPLLKQGVHTSNHNHYTVGICLNGSLDEEAIRPEQLTSLIALARWLPEMYPNLTVWKRHSDLRPTACPGKNFPYDQFLRGIAYDPVDKYHDVYNKVLWHTLQIEELLRSVRPK